MPILGRSRSPGHFSTKNHTAKYWQNDAISLQHNNVGMKKQLQQKIQKQTLKDEKLRQMEISGAEAVVQSLTDEGFNVKGEFGENRVSLDFTLSSGKIISLQVDYTSITTSRDNIVKLIRQLDR